MAGDGPLACIFDMDGVLLDSEPFWQDVEIEVFGSLGLHLSREDCRATMGMRVDEVVRQRQAERPWAGVSLAEVADAIVDGVVELVRTRGRPLPGVAWAMDFLEERGVRLALASSSSYRLIDAVLGRLGLAYRFEVCHSAEEEEAGKPDPAVYRSAAAKLGLEPGHCVAVEDSVAGVQAAKAAGMACLAVPDQSVAGAVGFLLADAILPSLEHLDAEVWAALSS